MENKKLEYVELGFENVHAAKIPVSKFKYLYIDGIDKHTSYSKQNGCYVFTNASYIEFEVKDDVKFKCYGSIHSLKRFLTFRDIVDITLFYADGTTENYWVDYNEPYDIVGAPNINQHNKFKDGYVNVVIANKINKWKHRTKCQNKYWNNVTYFLWDKIGQYIL